MNLPEPLRNPGRFSVAAWSGTATHQKTWAFRYYDCIDTDPNELSSTGVVCAAALHPGLNRNDLEVFRDHRRQLNEWLAELPDFEFSQSFRLDNFDDGVISTLEELPALVDGTSFALATKVLHRKRPWLIPIVDSELIDRYWPLTGKRKAVEAWSRLLTHIGDDMRYYREQLATRCFVLATNLDPTVTWLRILDIAVWMDSERRRSGDT